MHGQIVASCSDMLTAFSGSRGNLWSPLTNRILFIYWVHGLAIQLFTFYKKNPLHLAIYRIQVSDVFLVFPSISQWQKKTTREFEWSWVLDQSWREGSQGTEVKEQWDMGGLCDTTACSKVYKVWKRRTPEKNYSGEHGNTSKSSSPRRARPKLQKLTETKALKSSQVNAQ